MPEITFDAERHAYRVDGKPVPSVTQCLDWLVDWSKVPADVLFYKSAIGTAVHEAVHLDCRGVLDDAALDPVLRPYLAQWRKFLAESGYTVLRSEMRVSHPLGFAGTLDLILGRVERRNILRRYVTDIKTAAAIPPTAGPQTAAYQAAYTETFYQRTDGRRVLRLWPDGYRLDVLNDLADWSIFMSALNLTKWRTRNVQ